MWVTADAHIRQELLPNGRYDEARGNRRSACTGRCTVTGNHLGQIQPGATGEWTDHVHPVPALMPR
jgi:hypothetical protein